MAGARSNPRARSIAALALAGALGACALGDRAEAVYLHQHRVANALTEIVMAVEPNDPVLADVLYRREGELEEACGPLRRAGYQKLSGEPLSSTLRWSAVRTIDPCTAKAEEIAALLHRIDPLTAGYFLNRSSLAASAPARATDSAAPANPRPAFPRAQGRLD